MKIDIIGMTPPVFIAAIFIGFVFSIAILAFSTPSVVESKPISLTPAPTPLPAYYNNQTISESLSSLEGIFGLMVTLMPIMVILAVVGFFLGLFGNLMEMMEK